MACVGAYTRVGILTPSIVRNVELPEGERYLVSDCRSFELVGKNGERKRKGTKYKIRIVKNYTYHIMSTAFFEGGGHYTYCINKIDIVTGKLKIQPLMC